MDPIAKLTTGVKAFRDDRFPQQRATYESLVDHGQNPEVAVVACSDSRVDPAIVLTVLWIRWRLPALQLHRKVAHVAMQ